MPSRLEPMLAKPGHIPESDSGEWAYEIKWDGVRALGYADHGRWCMLSRRLEDVTARYPELAPIADALADHAAIVDGEVVALDPEGRPRLPAAPAPHGTDLADGNQGTRWLRRRWTT